MISLKQIEQGIDRGEHFVIGLAGKAASWLSALPVVYLSYKAGVQVVNLPATIAMLGAVSIEALGLAATAITLELRDYNATREDGAPRSPAVLGYAMIGLYTVASSWVTAVNVDPARPETRILWIWPVLSLIGTVLHGMRYDHARRLEERVQAVSKAAAVQTRAENRQHKHELERERMHMEHELEMERVRIAAQTAQPFAQPVRVQDLDELSTAEQDLLDIVRTRPGLSCRLYGEAVERSASWVSSALRKLEERGLVQRNGHGVQVA